MTITNITDQRSLVVEPAITKEPLTPPQYVAHWCKMFGNFAKGRIEKSRVMSRDDLTKKDAEFLLAHGVTQAQIAKQYRIPSGSVTRVFKLLGVDMTLKDSAPDIEIVQPSAPPEPQPTTPAPEIERRICWFTESRGKQGNTGAATVRIGKDGKVTFSSGFGKFFKPGEHVHIGLADDNSLLIKKASSGLKLGALKNSSRRSTCCGDLKCELQWRKVKLPGLWAMDITAESIWEGVLLNGSNQTKF